MKALIGLGFAALALAACEIRNERTDGCGLIGCTSSPYVRARGGPGLAGTSLAEVVSVMGGAPTGSVDVGGGRRALTWTRSQNDRDAGMLSCSETVITEGDRVTSYSRSGACGIRER